MCVETIDVAIIGGGVAGLAAAIAFARSGLQVYLLEQNNEFGRSIKGEAVRKSAEVFKLIFNEAGLPKSTIQIVYKTAKYFTPSTKKYALRTFPEGEKIGIDYRELINALVKIAIQEKVSLFLNSKVIDFIKEGDQFVGVIYQQAGQIKQLMPKLIICAAGLHGNLGLPEEIKPPKNVCPALKIIADNMSIPDPNELEFFLLAIPSVAWIFPKSKTKAELGITLWLEQLPEADKINLSVLLEKYIKTHPLLKSRLQDATFIYYQKEWVAFGGPVKQLFVPKIFYIGDIVGQVEAVGGSGIVSSMTIGYDLGRILGKTLKEKGILKIDDFEVMQKELINSEVGKKLKKEQSNAKVMRELLYSPLKSPEEIDLLWDKFKQFIESRGA
jgi:flavin-dependent dehydrogenase